MKSISQIILIFILIFTLFTIINCTKDKIVNSNDKSQSEFVPVQIDLQSGMEDNRIMIKFNNEKYFDSMLSNIVPFAGPVATFTTYLTRGQNNIYILSQFLGVAQPTLNQDSTFVHFENADKYYLGIELSDNKFNIRVQDKPFLYQ